MDISKHMTRLWLPLMAAVMLFVFSACGSAEAACTSNAAANGTECADGASPESSEGSDDAVPADEPSAVQTIDLRIEITGGTDVTLSWAPVDGASGLMITRQDESCLPLEVFTGDGAATVYTDAFLDTGRDHTYTVTAHSAGGDVIASGSLTVCLDTVDGTFNRDGSLYCYTDGKLLRGGFYGTLYFGADGRYTTGDTELDAYLRDITAACTDSGMTPIEKLRAVYDWVMDNSDYEPRAMLNSGDTGWEEGFALDMFKDGVGNCYSYAGAVAMLARNLGFEAVGVSGMCHQTYQWVAHGWTEVTLKTGAVYICDSEMEGVFSRLRDLGWDLFMKEYGATPTRYEA